MGQAMTAWRDIASAPLIVLDLASVIKVELGSWLTKIAFSDEGMYLIHFAQGTKKPDYWMGPIPYAPLPLPPTNGDTNEG